MRKISCFLLVLFFAAGIVRAQSPWVPGKGKGYAQLSYTGIHNYETLFSSELDDGLKLNREVSDVTLQTYVEYGVGSKDALLLVLPFKLLSTGDEILENPSITPTLNESGNFSSLGNIEVAYKRNFINNKFLLSGQVKAELPTGGFDESTGLRSGLDALTIVPSISAGKGSDKRFVFLSLGTGIRNNDYSGDLRVDAEAGIKPMEKLWIIGVINVVENFENGDAVNEITNLQTGLYVNNQEYFAIGLKGIVEASENLGINFAAFGAAGGNFVAEQLTLNLGFYYKW